MFFIEYLFQDPVYYFTVVAVVIGSVVLHELGHAFAATWEGDPTPRERGHITWDPVVHMGWLSLGLAAVIGIAWGQCPVTPAYFRHRRWGEVIVAFAGPAVNLSLALVSALVLVFVVRNDGSEPIAQFWWIALLYNVALFVLNMIPVPPLDGFTVASHSLRMGELGRWLQSMQPWPLLIVLVLISQGPFWSLARTGSEALLSMWASVFQGAL
jgi:Zn-dependent protease